MKGGFVCQHKNCRKSYSSNFNLGRHIESAHLGIKKFQCEVCGKSLSSKQNFTDHKNLHTGEKPYECSHPNCSATFRQQNQYLIHLQMHEQVRSLTQTSVPEKTPILAILGNRLANQEVKLTEDELLPAEINEDKRPKKKTSSKPKAINH